MTDPIEQVRILAALAPIRLPADREVALAGGLTTTRSIAEVLASIELFATEPATHFRAPPPQ